MESIIQPAQADAFLSFIKDFGFKLTCINEETAAVARWSIDLTRQQFLDNYLKHFKNSDADKLVTPDNFLFAEIQLDAYNAAEYNRASYPHDYNLTIFVRMDESIYSQTRKSYLHFTSNIKKDKLQKLIKQAELLTMFNSF